MLYAGALARGRYSSPGIGDSKKVDGAPLLRPPRLPGVAVEGGAAGEAGVAFSFLRLDAAVGFLFLAPGGLPGPLLVGAGFAEELD